MNAPTAPVFVVLTIKGSILARRLTKKIPGSEVHGLIGRVKDADLFFQSASEHLCNLFTAGRPLVGICAAGVLIRILAPVILEKYREPAVVALAEDGTSIVPLLGGHHGANDLARTLARETGGHAAITTASDVVLGIAFDNPPEGWRIANPSRVKAVVSALLAEEPVSLEVEAADASWLMNSGLEFSRSEQGVLITDRIPAQEDERLIFHPPVLAVGLGCERGVGSKEIIDLIINTLAAAGLAADSVGCVVSVNIKADEEGIQAAASYLGVPARFFSPEVLEAETPRLKNPSDVVFAEIGCHGVAEGAALAAVGSAGELVVTKRKSKRATCAIGRAPQPLLVSEIGSKRGRLTLIGLGPGADEWRTPAATHALLAADELVGYKLYLDLVDHLTIGKPCHNSPLSEEETRVRIALDAAAEGKSVALLCSGDAGIYALAALVFELLDREDRGDWNRLAIKVEPGVSAIQAAAARIGAPIGHDFCTISLSDLLTPLEDIVRRLEAAASGDFVVALYNPVSMKRRVQLNMAKEILCKARPKNTPVVLARNLGREGETVDVITLENLTADHADMLTLVLVGNSQTREIRRGEGRWVYTPRGYSRRREGTP